MKVTSPINVNVNFLKIDKNHYEKANGTIYLNFDKTDIRNGGKFQAFVSSWIDVIYSL